MGDTKSYYFKFNFTFCFITCYVYKIWKVPCKQCFPCSRDADVDEDEHEVTGIRGKLDGLVDMTIAGSLSR